jgi:uncharacterized MAPEG superfamily protein
MPTAIDYMNAYKGSGFPEAIVPILGTLFGTVTPYLLYSLLESDGDKSIEKSKIDGLLTVLQSMLLPAILFLSEFVFGGVARTRSPKAGFSPAAVQAAGVQPFDIVEANRIHQNQIESACIYIPASLSAAAAGANPNAIVATTITWVMSRAFYRFGYGQRQNPLWRFAGTVSSLTQSFLCLGLFAYAKYNNK